MAALVLSGCGAGGASAPSEATVYYSVSSTGAAAFDSVFYDDGHGTMVKVVSPSLTWNKGFAFTQPGSIEARLYVHALGSGKSTIKVVWTIGTETFYDSSFATAPSASHITLVLPHHAI
jgi:hypothetical protein